MYQPVMKARMAELERQKAEIAARRTEVADVLPEIHPGIANGYHAKVQRLIETLDDPACQMEALADIRSLVGKIVLSPGEKRGEVQAKLIGEVVGIVDFVRDGKQGSPPRLRAMDPGVITKVSLGSPG